MSIYWSLLMCLARWVSCRHTGSVNHRISRTFLSIASPDLSEITAFPSAKWTRTDSVCISLPQTSRQMASLASAHVCAGTTKGGSYPTEMRGWLRGAV